MIQFHFSDLAIFFNNISMVAVFKQWFYYIEKCSGHNL